MNDCKSWHLIAWWIYDKISPPSRCPIDIFGVGERLITSKSDPVFGAVYKIASIEKDGKWEPRIKISEAVEKITNPGLKKVYRVYNQKGRAIADLMTLLREVPDTEEPYRYINPEQPWRELYFENCTFKENETAHH